MTPQQFMENFGVIADSPEGIVKLRALVLSLATSGALSVRLKADGVAADLLVESKAMLEARKVGRRRRGRAQASDAQRCHDVPSTWCWGKLGDLGLTQTGATPKKDLLQADGPRIPFIRPGDIAGGRVDISREPIPMVAAETTGRIVEPGAVLMVCIGSVGKVGLCLGRATFNQQINAIQPVVASSAYIALALRTPSFQKRCKALASATTISILNKGKWESLSLPVPPLAEQKRIVAKVDELMAMLDDLEQRQEKKRTVAIHVSKASLDSLVNAEDPDQLARAWERVSKNFGVVAGSASGTKDLRCLLAELACSGKLSRNCSEVVCLDAVLGSVGEQRQACGARGPKILPLDGDEIPYRIPSNWRWVRIGELLLHSDAGKSPQCEKRSRTLGEYGVLKVSAVSWGNFRPEENKALPADVEPFEGAEVREGDYLLSRANTSELVARSVVVEHTPKRLLLSDKIVRLTFGRGVVDPRFISLYNNGCHARAHYLKHASGTSSSMKNVSRKVIHQLPVPLPSLAEQQHIFGRVRQLMELVDELELVLGEQRKLSIKLSESLPWVT